MKLPKTFMPVKNLDRKTEDLLTERVIKYHEIEDIYSLLKLPEYIRGYQTHPQKNEDKKIQAYNWHVHFENVSFDYLAEAGRVECFKNRSAIYDNIIIYSLSFPNNSELNELVRATYIDKIFLYKKYDKYKDWLIECLRKDCYLVAILVNKDLKEDLKFLKKGYIEKFGMVEV